MPLGGSVGRPDRGRQHVAHPHAGGGAVELAVAGGDQARLVAALGERLRQLRRVVKQAAARGALDDGQSHRTSESRCT